ncbi:MAG: DUF1501 domain-containing protein [Phycisphaerales bacterium]
MSDHELTAFTRREFLFTSLTLASAAVAVPAFIQRSALGMQQPAPGLSSIPGVPEDHVLVVIQLSGGNDGLNTVIPFRDDLYYRSRPVIGIKAEQVLKLGSNDVGLHPSMKGFQELYDEGMMTIVQGVGYPNPNRSHFKSMDIWHTADTTATGDGWLGRYFDAECCGYGKGESGKPDGSAPVHESIGQPGIAVMREAPLAMRGRKAQPIAFESAESFRWTGGLEKKDLSKYYDQLTKDADGASDAAAAGNGGHNSNFLTRTAIDARVSSDLIRKAVAAAPRVTYPDGGQGTLSSQLQMVASMVAANLKTRVYYVTLGGFDTHDNQGGANGRQAQLLQRLSGAVKAFYADLKKTSNDGRVMTMVFSEFGRRVAQNGSNGTDHGTAAPMFLFGPMVQAGVATKHPSLADLDQGDLKFGTDFRSVYAGILGGWLKADAKAILEGSYQPAPVLKKQA